MTFLFDVVALLGAAAVIAVLVGLGRRTLPAAVAIAVAAGAALVFYSEVWRTVDAVDAGRADVSRLTDAEARVRPAAGAGVNVQFLDWVRTRMRPGETFALLPEGDAAGPVVRPWTAYYLLPHRMTSRDKADVLVVYGSNDPVVIDEADSERFADGFFLVRPS